MKAVLIASALSAVLAAGSASAQDVNLSGRWQCIAMCLGPTGSFAFITQNGWQLNVLSEAGQPSRGWIDYPGHIWLERPGLGAVYAPGGLGLQFDNGAVWQRAPEMAVPPPPPIRRRG
jgi:hypothetical protein